MAFWFGRKKKAATAHPTDTRLEIVSEGLISASSDLQDFVGLLRKKYQYSPEPAPVKEGSGDAS